MGYYVREFYENVSANALPGFVYAILAFAFYVLSHLIYIFIKQRKVKFRIWYNKKLSTSIASQGLIKEYTNIEEATKHICKEISNSKNVSIYTGLGRKIMDVIEKIDPGVNVTVFLPNVNPPDWATNWLEHRANELKDFSFETAKNHITSIEDSVKEFKSKNTGATTDIQYYNAPHTYRIIQTEKVVFFSPYIVNRCGQNRSFVIK